MRTPKGFSLIYVIYKIFYKPVDNGAFKAPCDT